MAPERLIHFSKYELLSIWFELTFSASTIHCSHQSTIPRVHDVISPVHFGVSIVLHVDTIEFVVFLSLKHIYDMVQMLHGG